MSLGPGTRLGPYEILSSLGAGGMGEVYRARDPRLSRDVAIKILAARISSSPDALRRFEREARASAALNHPNILAVYDFGAEGAAQYVVSELLIGQTLREALSDGPLPASKTLTYAAQAARGLAAAHDEGIVHRDLKPENLFITRDGRVKILDFGLAKLVDTAPGSLEADIGVTRAGGTMQGVVLGTVGYMAPEQVRAQHTDQRTDIFALGVVMHEMLTGRPPFAEPSAIETMTAIATKDPPELTRSGSGTPAPLVRIVRRCLEKRPGDRFQSARDLAFALENLTDATPALPASERRVTSRSLARVSGLILALAVAAAVGAFSVGRVSRLPEPSFRRLTSQRGIVRAARFGPDDHTIWYSAAWNGGPSRVFVTRVDTRESSPLDVPPGDLVAITSTGEIVLLAGRGATGSVVFGGTGTLARVSIMGGATRELIEQVEDADVSADASTFAIVRTTGGRYRLEYPPGKVLYETNGYISSPRLSPRGDRIAFLDHPVTGDDRGVVAVVDLTGKRTVLTPEWIGEQGLAWTPNGREIWFAAGPGDEPRAIYAVTLGGQVRLVYRAPMHLKLEDVGPDGRVLLSGEDFRNDVIAVSAEDGRERDLSWFHLQATRGLSSDGRMLVFSWLSGFDYASYLRPTDGSPAVRLGVGNAQDLSADGRWVIAASFSSPNRLTVLPTGPGDVKTVPLGPVQFDASNNARWMADGQRIVFAGTEAGRRLRSYVVSVSGGPPSAVTPEGTVGTLPSPDGRFLIVRTADGIPTVFDLKTNQTHPVPGLAPTERVARWESSGRAIYVYRTDSARLRVFRLDLSTGGRESTFDVTLADPNGIVTNVLLTSDMRLAVCDVRRQSSNLYLVAGLK